MDRLPADSLLGSLHRRPGDWWKVAQAPMCLESWTQRDSGRGRPAAGWLGLNSTHTAFAGVAAGTEVWTAGSDLPFPL